MTSAPGEAIHKSDLDGSGFCSEVACDHSRFTRAQRQDPYRFSSRERPFFWRDPRQGGQIR